MLFFIFLLFILLIIFILSIIIINDIKFKKTHIFHNITYISKLLLFILVILYSSLVYKYNIITIIFTIILVFILFFFRNNYNLNNNNNNNDILSPSSSLIKNIKNNYVTTYLSLIDRHFVISPFDLKIIDIKNKLYKNDQERKTIIISDNKNKISELHLIVKKPFTGPGILSSWIPKIFYDERIVIFNKKGDTLKKGERLGLIRFGSSMEYKFPISYKLNIKENNKLDLGNIIGIM